MYRSDPCDGAERVCQVLAGMAFPAAKWQLVMQAEEYGADAATRAELWALPAGCYADVQAVVDAVSAARSFGRAVHPEPVPASPLRVPGRVRPLR